MLTEGKVLLALDNCFEGYCHSITLSHPYIYLIDSRLNIFKGCDDDWAVVAEVLGYNPSGDRISLELIYFGNCLKNLEPLNNQPVNSIEVYPIDVDSFRATIELDVLQPAGEYWLVRGRKLRISHNRQDYMEAGIELKEYEPGEICAEEIARLLIIQYADLFRATDKELYSCIPSNLKKIMVLNEWYHREYYQFSTEIINSGPSIERLQTSYIANGLADKIDINSIGEALGESVSNNARYNQEEWQNNRPGNYETWQMLAKVIVTGDTSFYLPTLQSNNHWKNWPGSGSM